MMAGFEKKIHAKGHLRISVVVPSLNESERLPLFLASLEAEDPHELIIVDGGSEDGSLEIAERFSPRVHRQDGGLASQLNRGADEATGDVLFFPYVDSRLPEGWSESIANTLEDPRRVGGAFRLGFDSPLRRYRLIAATANLRTRLGWGPTGDQGIFVRREAFEEVGGYREDVLLEDLDLMARLRRKGGVAIAPRVLRTSVRRWESEGLLRTTLSHWGYLAAHLFRLGGARRRLAYRRYRQQGRRGEARG